MLQLKCLHGIGGVLAISGLQMQFLDEKSTKTSVSAPILATLSSLTPYWRQENVWNLPQSVPADSHAWYLGCMKVFWGLEGLRGSHNAKNLGFRANFTHFQGVWPLWMPVKSFVVDLEQKLNQIWIPHIKMHYSSDFEVGRSMFRGSKSRKRKN